MDCFTITIARGFGSGGKEIGSILAKELGIHCYETRILTLASQYTGTDRSRFAEVDEKLRGGYLNNVLKNMPRQLNFRAVEKSFTSDKCLFEAQSEIIRRLNESESCIIIGKCADFILKDRKNVFSFYIEAPRAYCVKNTMEKMDVTEAKAHQIIAKTDKYRADYYRYYTHGNYWTNPVNYDLTLNSERVGRDNCVAVIKSYVAMRMAQYQNIGVPHNICDT